MLRLNTLLAVMGIAVVSGRGRCWRSCGSARRRRCWSRRCSCRRSRWSSPGGSTSATARCSWPMRATSNAPPRSRWPPSRPWRWRSTRGTVPLTRRSSASSATPPPSPGSSACRPTRWSASARPRSCTTSASWPCPITSSRSRGRSPTMSAARCGRTPAWAPPSSNRCRFRSRWPNWCAATTSAGTAAAIPSGLRGAEIPLGARILDRCRLLRRHHLRPGVQPGHAGRRGRQRALAGSGQCARSVGRVPLRPPAASPAGGRRGGPARQRARRRRAERRRRHRAGLRRRGAADPGGASRRHRGGQPGAWRPVRDGRGDGHQPGRVRHDGGDRLEAGPPGALRHRGAVPARPGKRRLALPVRRRTRAPRVSRPARPRRRRPGRRRDRLARVRHERRSRRPISTCSARTSRRRASSRRWSAR